MDLMDNFEIYCESCSERMTEESIVHKEIKDTYVVHRDIDDDDEQLDEYDNEEDIPNNQSCSCKRYYSINFKCHRCGNEFSEEDEDYI